MEWTGGCVELLIDATDPPNPTPLNSTQPNSTPHTGGARVQARVPAQVRLQPAPEPRGDPEHPGHAPALRRAQRHARLHQPPRRAQRLPARQGAPRGAGRGRRRLLQARLPRGRGRGRAADGRRGQGVRGDRARGAHARGPRLHPRARRRPHVLLRGLRRRLGRGGRGHGQGAAEGGASRRSRRAMQCPGRLFYWTGGIYKGHAGVCQPSDQPNQPTNPHPPTHPHAR